MATEHFFDGKIIKLPGVYSTIKSVAPTVFTTSSYSKSLIINTDPTIGFGGSVNGELTKGGDALYRLRSLSEAQAFLKAGKLWQLTTPLFNPSRQDGAVGTSELYYINALTTKAPTITPTLANGTLVIQCLDEGPQSNGTKIGSVLKTGYGLSIESGVRDTTKYILKFWLGTFKGLYTDGLPYDGIPMSEAVPELLVASDEITSVDEFVAWASTSNIFNAGFKIKTSTAGEFTTVDKTTNTMVVSTGGTATYDLDGLTETLSLLRTTDFNVLISLNPVGATGADVINARLQYFVQNETKYVKYLAIPGTSTGSSIDLTPNSAYAVTANSEKVWVINGTPRKNASYAPKKYRVYDSTYLTAAVVGRILGLPPQVPGNFKDIDIDGLEGPLSELQEMDALDTGVLAVRYDEDFQRFVIIRAINTLQKNTQLQNPDGSTFSIQISRICTQMNTDIVINAKRELFNNNTGANLFTVSPAYMRDYTEGQLNNKVATPQQDNLIISWSDVSVERQGDAYFVCYKFQTNTEIAFAFFTGFALN